MNKTRINTKLIQSLSTVLFVPTTELIKLTHQSATTWYSIMSNPIVITMQQLLAFANGLHIPVKRFFSTGKTDVIGRRDDYVEDNYLPCQYDGAKLRRIVASHSNITWQKASEIIGITPLHLRKSLMGTKRTPITRFLTFCETFDIDPFTILIDPNPVPKRRKRTSSLSATTNDEIAALQQEMSDLHTTMRNLRTEMQDLRTKYEALLSDHQRLASRVNMNIDTFNNNGYIGIAAEPPANYEN